MGRVEGKVALLSGGASGLGLASARRLAEEGATVVLADINTELGREMAAGIPGAEFVHLDVTQEKNWIQAIDAVVAQHGKLDILLNAAGIVKLASIEDTSEELWRQINAVGTDGTFFGCKHAVRVMKESGGGSIINMCSTASIQGMPRIFAYAASKSAIRAMTKSVACLSAQSQYGIRCNSIHPGNIDTPMFQGVHATVFEADPAAAEALDANWMGEPIDVANMVLFLSSAEAQSVNGAEMVIDNTVTITEGGVPKARRIEH